MGFQLLTGSACSCGAFGDLAEQISVIVECSDVASVDRVGVGAKVVVAEGFQVGEYRVDLAFDCQEAGHGSRSIATSTPGHSAGSRAGFRFWAGLPGNLPSKAVRSC